MLGRLSFASSSSSTSLLAALSLALLSSLLSSLLLLLCSERPSLRARLGLTGDGLSSLVALASCSRASSGSTEGGVGRLDEVRLPVERDDEGVEVEDGEWRDRLPCLPPPPLCFLPCRSRLLPFLSFLSRRLLLDSFSSPSTREEMPAVDDRTSEEDGEEDKSRDALLDEAEEEGDELDEDDEEVRHDTREGREDDDDRGATGAL